MRRFHLVPDDAGIDFVRLRLRAFGLSLVLLLAAVVSLAGQGLDLGVDFAGGTLLDVRAGQRVDLAALRGRIAAIGLGDFELQEYGAGSGLLIRVERLPEAANARVAGALRETLGPDFEFLRVETVGPRVGAELLRNGLLATALSLLAIAAYVTFRFEWQFGLAAIVAIFHDVATTIGLYSLTRIEFNLSSVAAILLLAGYSINDTIVVFDRIRETLRKRKSGDLAAVVNESVNRTLRRTIATSGTTMLAVIPLLVFGGVPLLGFSVALAWGVVVGTYSSIFVAAPLLLYLPPVGRAAAAVPGKPELPGAAAPGHPNVSGPAAR